MRGKLCTEAVLKIVRKWVKIIELIPEQIINFLVFWSIWLLIPLLIDTSKAIVYMVSLLIATQNEELSEFELEFYPYVSVVIPIYNSSKTLKMCMDSILDQSYQRRSIQIICVDNGSKDNSFEVFQKFQSENQDISVMWVSIDRPSKSMALNVGMYSGQGTYLINLDSDTWLDRNAIINVVKAFEKDSTLMAATGSIRVDTKVKRKKSLIDMVNYCEVVEYLISFDIGKRFQSMTNTVFTLSGAFSIFRRETIMQSFLYQERTVSEDTDLTFHIRDDIKSKKGCIGCISEAFAYVEPIESLSQLYSQRLRWQRGEIEVASAYYKNVPSVFKSIFNIIGRTLLTDHTLAIAQMSWTFLLPFMYIVGYSLPLVAEATVCMFISYTLLDVLYFCVAYKGADSLYRKELYSVRWVVIILPLYRYMLYWFRMAGNIQVLAEGKSWKTQNPIEQIINALELTKKQMFGWVASKTKLNKID